MIVAEAGFPRHPCEEEIPLVVFVSKPAAVPVTVTEKLQLAPGMRREPPEKAIDLGGVAESAPPHWAVTSFVTVARRNERR